MGQNNFLANPFSLYGITWSFVLLIYQLGWSHLVPNLSRGYIIFLSSTICISFILGYIFYSKKIFTYKPLSVIPFDYLKKCSVILYILFILEIICAREIPFISYLLGNRENDYTDFGLPFVHVILNGGLTVGALFSYYGYISINNTRRKCIKYLVIFCIPFLLMFNRGGMMFCFLGCLLIYLMKIKNLKKIIIKISILLLLVLYIFGLLGNLRTDVGDAKNLLLEFGHATDSFKESGIPPEFFWSYIYIATPLANSQNMVNVDNRMEPSLKAYRDFTCFELLPELIAKRISTDTMHRQEKDLIFDSFNVCSVYGRTYKYLGWWGPIFMYVFWIFWVIVTIGLIPKKSPFYVPAIASVNLITIMNLFDNMFVFMGLITVPFIFIILSVFFKHGSKNFSGLCNIQ